MARVLLAIVLASMVGCHRPPTATNDAGVADAAPVASASVTPPTLAPPIVDASVDAHMPTAESDGMVGLLVEHVLIDNGQFAPSSYGYDLLVLTTPPGEKSAKRSQPFCPPLKRNMYEVCRRFRACSVADAGAGVVCDGSRFELVQHDGVTFLMGEDKEIQVHEHTPAIGRPTTRQRHAYVDL